jgi:hypothetical protein
MILRNFSVICNKDDLEIINFPNPSIIQVNIKKSVDFNAYPESEEYDIKELTLLSNNREKIQEALKYLNDLKCLIHLFDEKDKRLILDKAAFCLEAVIFE